MKNESQPPEDPAKSANEGGQSLGAQILIASEMGSAIVFLSLAGYFAGNFLDQRVHCAPYGVVVGILLGLTLGLAFVVKRSIELDKKAVSRK